MTEENLNPEVENELLPVEEIQYEDDDAGETIQTAPETYGSLKGETVLYDDKTGQLVDIKTLPPFERIKMVSNREGKTINEPVKNCKHCYGRGYTAIDAHDGVPTPCTCVFRDFYKQNPGYKNTDFPSFNRKTRREMKKYYTRKQLPNPALEKRQKRMNAVLTEAAKSLLAKDVAESAEIESMIVEPEVVPFDGIESAEFTEVVKED